ncbi:two-component system sensor histidine kinase CiaH [Weissella beninensis]|uniref:histidine kinase n=1 Tax=Periweissella beninensis TaxID=504936 RepID=A0ABT0VJJ5_9LACO|nr:HAMP domain-containing sensor histidine kinase [Periweissella beninensis]MBM7543989.1 two-component system sensor histidine kinase CiaH [Periweissella beninensis]MCM2437998.1 HAMP domain-containing histidine kinase [Periweissella beninensis]
MNEIVTKKQRLKMFLTEAFSFSLIFAILGVIIFWTFQHTLFSSVNQNLEHQASQVKKNGMIPNPGDFKTMTLLFNKSGEIVNYTALGDRGTTLSKIQLKTNQLNVMQTIDLSNGVSFKTMLIKLPKQQSQTNQNIQGDQGQKNSGDIPKYALLMENITAEKQSVSSFLKVLLVSFFVFAVLAITISWWLVKRNMQPVLKSWQQQQDFVDSAAHELKTPLTIIQNKLELLLTKPNAKIKDEYDPIILSLSEIRRLTSLSADLLTLAKANSNMTVINTENIDISSFLAKIVEPYQEIAQLDNKKFTIDLLASGKIILDPQRIHQLLVILLDNALKYTDENAQIEVKSEIVNRQLVIEVTDNGRGISEKGKQHVFDRFYRDDKSGARETGGTGLGLAIAKWIVDMHKGKISVHDAFPHGSKFIVNLPIKNKI